MIYSPLFILLLASASAFPVYQKESTSQSPVTLYPGSMYYSTNGQLLGSVPRPPSLPSIESSTTEASDHAVIVPKKLGHNEKNLELKFTHEHLQDMKKKAKIMKPIPISNPNDPSANLLYTVKRMQQNRKGKYLDPDPILDHSKNLAKNLLKIDEEFLQGLFGPARHKLYLYNAKQKAKIIDMINAGTPVRIQNRVYNVKPSQMMKSVDLVAKRKTHVVRYVKDKTVSNEDRRIKIISPSRISSEKEWKDFEPPIDYAGSSTKSVYYKAGPTVYQVPKPRLKKKMRPRRFAQPLSMIYNAPLTISHFSQGSGLQRDPMETADHFKPSMDFLHHPSTSDGDGDHWFRELGLP